MNIKRSKDPLHNTRANGRRPMGTGLAFRYKAQEYRLRTGIGNRPFRAVIMDGSTEILGQD